MHEEEDYPPKPKWVGWVIIIGMVLVVLGLLNLGVRMMLPTATESTNVIAKDPVLLVGKTLAEGSDCMRCHMVAYRGTGPSFQEVAARYADQPDAVQQLASKVRNGSVGEWGRVIMPRHPQVNQQDAEQMVRWVLAQKP